MRRIGRLTPPRPVENRGSTGGPRPTEPAPPTKDVPACPSDRSDPATGPCWPSPWPRRLPRMPRDRAECARGLRPRADARRGPAPGRRRLPRRRPPRGPRPGHRRDRRRGRLHRGRLPRAGAQARPRRRGILPAVHDQGLRDAGRRAVALHSGRRARRSSPSPRPTSPRSPSAPRRDVEAVPVVFAGYGITAKEADDKLDYDDYAGLDVKGKAVLILRREPQAGRRQEPVQGPRERPATPTSAARPPTPSTTARGPWSSSTTPSAPDKAGDHLLPFGYAGGESDQSATIPFAMITRELADQVLDAAGAGKLADAEKAIDADLKPQSKPLEGVTLTREIQGRAQGADGQERRRRPRRLGADSPTRRSSSAPTTTTSAAAGSSRARSSMFSRDIHNGADDNASGTAMVLEMARRLARRTRPPAPPRRLHGLQRRGEGVARVAPLRRAPALSALDRTVFMVNFDMVGRLNEQDELTVFGTGSTARRGRAGRCARGVVGVQDQEGQGDVRRHRRERPRVVLHGGRAGPVRLHGRASRLPQAERRHPPDQLPRHGPDRRLRRGAPARPRPPPEAARVRARSAARASPRAR